MKLYLLFFSILFTKIDTTWAQQSPQYLRAEYEVEKTYAASNVANPTVFKIEYKGVLITDGSKLLYWEEPQYLAEFPDGVVRAPKAGGGLEELNLSKSARQNLFYVNVDSSLVRRGVDMPHEFDNVYLLLSSATLKRSWKMSNEIKEISGMHCQLLYNGYWERVWVNTDFNMTLGPCGIFNVPGLVVEAESKALRSSLRLKSYSWTSPADFSFWPTEFNGKKFEKMD